MAIGLVRYERRTEGGMTCWALPDGATSSIDLRRLSQITDPAATGHAIAIYPGALPDGSVELESGNATRDRDAWLSTLGFRPQGDTAVDQAWSMLLDGADDAHADAVRPLRCGRPDRFEMWLGGRRERTTTHIERLKQAVYTRRDLDTIFDDVQAGKLPDGIHRKVLKAEADRLGLDWRTLRSKAARWKNETAIDPTTEINDPFKSGSFVLLNTYNGWTTPQGASPFQTGGDYLALDGGQSTGSYFAWHQTSLSASANQADGIDVTRNGDSDYNIPAGVAARGDGTSTAYISSHYQASLRIHSSVSNALTQLTATARTGTAPYRLRIQPIGSTIKASQFGSAWDLQITNTTITTGLRVGMWVFALGYTNYFAIVQDFYGVDFVAPTVTNNTASATFGTGGTVQMSASDSPTSWSLTGSLPTGVSINSSGLVTWTGLTPTAVHTIGVRATNAIGNGDGTLTLTITDPPAAAATGPTKRQLGGAVWMMGRRG